MGLIAKTAINMMLIILTIVIGIFLQKNGKPYSPALLAIHKFATIAFTVFITMMLIQYVKINTPGSWLTYMVIAGAFFLVALLVSGGLMSIDRLDSVMELVHRIATAGFLLSVGYILYSFLKNGA